MSVTGKPLYPMELPNRAELEANLTKAEDDLAKAPDSADALIWVGRRQGYLWRYKDAIATFTKGIERFPEDARFYRHRGHRYITVRNFDGAVADFEKAVTLIKGKPDEIEPDGAPNAAGKPRSSLQFNIWYHLGLAYYLKGDYANAKRAYDECMKVSTNDDSITATSDWQWMTYMRLGDKAAAAKVLERITPKMDILENGSYHKRLLMYKGLEKPEALLDTDQRRRPDHRHPGLRRRQLLLRHRRHGQGEGDLRPRPGRQAVGGLRLHRRRGGSRQDELTR